MSEFTPENPQTPTIWQEPNRPGSGYNPAVKELIPGPQGPAATIAVGSVVSGTPVSVVNVGTATDAILNFTLAKGDKGDKGDTGPMAGSPLSLIANTTAEVPLTVQGIVGQTGNLFEARDSSGTIQTRIASGGSIESIRQHRLLLTDPANPGSIIRGAASQTANLAEFQNSAGTVVGATTADGRTIHATGIDPLGHVGIATPFPGRPGLVVRGAASQTANLAEFQDSAGTVLTRISAAGHFFTTGAVTLGNVLYAGTDGNSFQNARAHFFSAAVGSNTGEKGLVVRGAASQTANLAEFQNSAGTVLTRVNNEGRLLVAPDGTAESAFAGLEVHPIGTGNPGLVVRGNASMTANLAEFRNSAGGIVSGFDPAGRPMIGGAGAFSAAALGAYAGAFEVVISGTVRRVPYYAV